MNRGARVSLIACFFVGIFATAHPRCLTAQSPTLLLDGLSEPGTNAPFRAIWNTTPTVRYELQNSGDLEQWTTVGGYPIEATSLSLLHPLLVPGTNNFYRVRLLDEQPPEIGARIPAVDGFAVKRFAEVSVSLVDLTGVAADSIALTIGATGPLTTNSPGVIYTNNTLVYVPGATPLGDFGETVTATLAVSDTLGNATNLSWSFDLEVEPQVVSELFVFGSQQAQIMGQSMGNSPTAFLAGSHPEIAKQTPVDSWTLFKVDPGQLILVYTTTPPTIPVGTYVCNQTPGSVGEIFYRKVDSTYNDNGNKWFRINTVDVPLEEMVQQGSISITGDSVILPLEGGGAIQKAVSIKSLTEFDPLGFSLDGATIKLRSDGFETTIGGLTSSTGSGQPWLSIAAEELHWWLTPSIQTSLEIGLTGLKRFEGVVRGELDAAIVLDASVLQPGAAVDVEIFDIPAVSEPSVLVYLGAVGTVPIFAKIHFDLRVIAEAESQAQLSFRTGIRQEASVEFGINYVHDRDPAIKWVYNLIFAPSGIVRPEGKIDGEVSLNLKLEPSVSFLVLGLAGVKASNPLRGGIVVDELELPSPHLTGRQVADASFDLSPEGPALAWLDPTPARSLILWDDQWHIFPNQDPLSFVKQPDAATVVEGKSVRFSTAVNRSEGVSYRWYHNGAPIPRATLSYLDLLNVNAYHAGAYFVRATAGHETVDSAVAALTVLVPPAITQQPQYLSVTVGDQVGFSVSATGSAPLGYQWLKDGVNIGGAIASSYTINAAQTGDAGVYTVVVSNAAGNITSAAVALTVHSKTQPAPAGMVLIPAGAFEMGDTFSEGAGNELPVHTVNVSAFYMDQHEVTKALWDEVYSWAVAHGYSFYFAALGKPANHPVTESEAANHPVQRLSWYNAVKWCNARSEKEGRTPAYYTSAAKDAGSVYRTGDVNVQNGWVNWSAGYRLPTEAEWEKAARGPVSGQRFPWGNTITHSQANYSSYGFLAPHYNKSPTQGFHPDYDVGSKPYTSPVGAFAANGYGLYDMAGNVFEWCWDWYENSYYSSSPGTDPKGPYFPYYRIFRGGSWDGHADLCRSANRYNLAPSSRGRTDLGFRTVLPTGQQ
jgi:formylglycine-generating enzyme required for sulfatase activity